MDKNEEQSVPITARIPLGLFADLCSEIKDIHQTRSEFMKEAIEEKLISDNKELIESKIKYMEKEVEILKAKKDQIKERKKEVVKITQEEIDFLKETREILLKDPSFLWGRIKLYKNSFNKHYRISEENFWELLDKVDNTT